MTRQSLQLAISVHCKETFFGDSIVITGADERLGSWNPASTPCRLNGSAWPAWTATAELERDVDPLSERQPWIVEFKAVIVRSSSKQDWEAFAGNRVVIVDFEAPAGFSPLERATSFTASFAFVFGAADGSVEDSLHIRAAAAPHATFVLPAPVPSTVVPPAPAVAQAPGRVILLSANTPARNGPAQPVFRPLPGSGNVFASPLTRGRSVPVNPLPSAPMPLRKPMRRSRSLSLPRIAEDPEAEREAEREHHHWVSSTPPAAPSSWHMGNSSPDDGDSGEDSDGDRRGRVPALWLPAARHVKPIVLPATPFAGVHTVAFA